MYSSPHTAQLQFLPTTQNIDRHEAERWGMEWELDGYRGIDDRQPRRLVLETLLLKLDTANDPPLIRVDPLHSLIHAVYHAQRSASSDTDA